MSTLTLNISDLSVMPRLLDTLKQFKGVSVVPKSSYDEAQLSKEEGEQLVRDTLVPAYREVLAAERNGQSLPDAHDILDMLD